MLSGPWLSRIVEYVPIMEVDGESSIFVFSSPLDCATAIVVAQTNVIMCSLFPSRALFVYIPEQK